MKLIDVTKNFATEEQCIAYLEQSRWPDGVIRCTTCGNDKVSVITRKSQGKNKRVRIYQCLEPTCKQQFSCTSGTVFADSHLPITKWFMAIALVIDAKKEMSAMQLQRHLGVSYRTAWYLAHRIREAMLENTSPKLTGTVEIDETYIGGKARGRTNSRRNKDIVLGLRQRGGPLRLVQIKTNSQWDLYQGIKPNLDKSVKRIITDEWGGYNFNMTQYQNAQHDRIKHKAKIYVRGDVYTNTIENAFSLLKRGMIGSYHQLSIKHLQRYLNEFAYRFNRREIVDAFEETVQRLTGFKPIQYKQLTASK